MNIILLKSNLSKMNLLAKFAILCCVDIYIFMYIGKFYGFIGLGIICIRFLYNLGILRSPKIFRGAFSEGMVYVKDYQGSYHNPEAYKEALNLITTFKLKEFLLIGIFYDKPGEVPEDKLRSSIGIFRRNVGFPDPVPKEFEEYCKNNDYYSAELPMTSCLYSSWDYSNFFTMMVGISKFGKILKQSLEDVLFKKTFKIKENPKIIIELYVSESKMEFWVPTVNENKFFIYKKEEKPKSE